MSPRNNKLLEVTPLTLIFPREVELDGTASCSLQLSNKTDHRVSFKVDTTSPNNYAISPECGILLPRSKCTILVVMKHPDILCHDEFLVQSVIVTEDASPEETAATLCKEQPGNSVDEVNSLPVSYARKMAISHTSNLNAPELVQEKGACSGIKTEKPSSQVCCSIPAIKSEKGERSQSKLLRLNANIWDRTDTSTQGLEAQRSACGKECQPYNAKSHELNEVPEKSNQPRSFLRLNGKIWKRTDTSTEGFEAEQSARGRVRHPYNGKSQELNELLKNSNQFQDHEELRLQVERQASSSNHSVNNIIQFTHSELREGTNGFDDSLKIGEGGYGVVYRGRLHHTPVAIKKLKNKQYGETDFNQEVDIISRVRHPNLVMLIGACPEAYALVFEFMPNGSLDYLLKNKEQSKTLTWEIRIRIALDICLALIFLHSAVKPHGIVHGDIKPANILLDSNYVAKVSDFGNCRKMNRIETRTTPHHCTKTLKGTFPYMDQEYIDSGELTPQYDVYSFGIVLLELVTRRDPVGLRKTVGDALQNGRFKKFVDDSAGKWPFEEAKKMAKLGLRCSDPSRKNRPDLEKEVLGEIKSMMHVAFPQ